MIQVFPVPVPVRTLRGTCLARFAIASENPDDPVWVLYRDSLGRWFAAMVDGAQAAA